MWPFSAIRARRDLQRQCIDEILEAATRQGIHLTPFAPAESRANRPTLCNDTAANTLRAIKKEGVAYSLEFFLGRNLVDFGGYPVDLPSLPNGFISHPVGIAPNLHYDEQIREREMALEHLAEANRTAIAQICQREGFPFYTISLPVVESSHLDWKEEHWRELGFDMRPWILGGPHLCREDDYRVWGKELAEELGLSVDSYDIGKWNLIDGIHHPGSPIPVGEKLQYLQVKVPSEYILPQANLNRMFSEVNLNPMVWLSLCTVVDPVWLQQQKWHRESVRNYEATLESWETTPLAEWERRNKANRKKCPPCGGRGGHSNDDNLDGWDDCEPCQGTGKINAQTYKNLLEPHEPKHLLEYKTVPIYSDVLPGLPPNLSLISRELFVFVKIASTNIAQNQ